MTPTEAVLVGIAFLAFEVVMFVLLLEIFILPEAYGP